MKLTTIPDNDMYCPFFRVGLDQCRRRESPMKNWDVVHEYLALESAID